MSDKPRKVKEDECPKCNPYTGSCAGYLCEKCASKEVLPSEPAELDSLSVKYNNKVIQCLEYQRESEKWRGIAERMASKMKEFDERYWFEPKPDVACGMCDMGEAGYSKHGPGHHDDKCGGLIIHEALSEYEKECK